MRKIVNKIFLKLGYVQKSELEKIKNTNSELEKEIEILVKNPFSQKGMSIRIKYEMKYKFEDSLWKGDYSSGKNFYGLMKKIT